MNIGLDAFIILASILFSIGLLGVLIRRNVIVVFMCLELMLTASILALVAFSRYNDTMDGNIFVFFIITVAAAEVAVGLAVIVALYKRLHTVNIESFKQLKH